MKAEEVIKKYVPSVVSGTQVKKYEDVTIIEMMKEYARHKLKEQRELCANGTRMDVLNAPEPKLD